MGVQRAVLLMLPNGLVDIIKSITNAKRLKKWKKQGKPVPPPHVVKQLAIKEYQQKGNVKLLIETGTYYGDMLYALRREFTQLYSIELSEYFYNKAVKRFKNQKNIKILHGDSGEVLYTLMPQISQPVMFWLDGHYSGGKTAKGSSDCPIYNELDAIFTTEFNHIILIDDAREFNGNNSYPTIAELRSYVLLRRPNSTFSVEDDIIRIVLN